MDFTAIYRTERNGNVKSTTSMRHTSKKDFALELRLNGFRVIAIYNNQEINEIKASKDTYFTVAQEYVREVLSK